MTQMPPPPRPLSPPYEVLVGGARGAELERALGTRRIPILHPTPQLVMLDPPNREGAGPELVYLVDVDRLELAGLLEATVQWVAAQRGGTPAEVLADVRRVGLPIRAEGTALVLHGQVVL
jgi:hypothetical protein